MKDNYLESVVKAIGSIVLSIFFLLIPIGFGLFLAFRNAFMAFLFGAGLSVEFIYLFLEIWNMTRRRE